MNKVVKDAFVKYKRLQGFYTPFVPGWDCHGLPIEHKVLTTWQENPCQHPQVGEENFPSQLREECRSYATQWVSHQMSEFKSLGIFSTFLPSSLFEKTC